MILVNKRNLATYKLKTMVSILNDKYSNYRYCIVRECKNTSIKTPEKLWIRVPRQINMRNSWLRLARRDPESLSTQTQIYLCEDHFDLENDMENYMEFKIMGSVKRIRMKAECIPTRFKCHTDRKRKLIQDTNDIQDIPKKTTKTPSLEQDRLICTTETSKLSHRGVLNKDDAGRSCYYSLKCLDMEIKVKNNNIQYCNKATQVKPLSKDTSCQVVKYYANKSIQTNDIKHYRSKHDQCSTSVKNATSSPINLTPHQSIATSPFKPERINIILPSYGRILPRNFNLTEKKSQGASSIASSPFKASSPTTDNSIQKVIINEQKLNIQCTVSRLKQNPRSYVGIPKEIYFIVDIIQKRTKLSEQHIILCLMKLRFNITFSQLADDFDISLPQASIVLCSKILINVVTPFLKSFTKMTINNILPIAFNQQCKEVNCGIDCIKTEIQKLKRAIQQSMTLSICEKANTCKYLLACTPDGSVSCASKGYGGRIGDINLLQDFKFLNTLELRSQILAYRDYKHIEMYLKQRGITLLRPPNISTSSKLTKIKAKQTEELASLRTHYKRVISNLLLNFQF